MAKLYNLARVNTATTGTGTITLGSAVAGYLTFALAGVADGDVVDYGIKDGSNSEIGTGTYTASGTTLTRSVTKSTNANSAINLSGTAEVFITPRAETLNDAALFSTGTLGNARIDRGTLLKAVNVNSTDLNNLKTAGLYDGSSLTNSPDGTANWFYIIVQQHSAFVSGTNEWVQQFAFGLNPGTGHWIRTETGGTWNAWRQVQLDNSGGRVLLNTLTASNVATLSDTTSLTSAYNDYEFVFENLVSVTNSVQGQLQVFSGGSYQTTSYLSTVLGGQGVGPNDNAVTTYIHCSRNAVANSVPGITGTFRVYGPAGTGSPKVFKGEFANKTTTPAAEVLTIGGFWNGGNGAVTGFRFQFSSGNISSGSIKIYGMA